MSLKITKKIQKLEIKQNKFQNHENNQILRAFVEMTSLGNQKT